MIKTNRFSPKLIGGFTLIELIMVIVILSILAAIALPKFQSFSSDSRRLVLESIASSARQAAENAKLLCTLNRNTCTGSGSGYVIVNGVQRIFWNDYPDAGYPSDITRWMTLSGVTIFLKPPDTSIIGLSNSRDPENCAVIYSDAPLNAGPIISIVESGCN